MKDVGPCCRSVVSGDWEMTIMQIVFSHIHIMAMFMFLRYISLGTELLRVSVE